MAIPDGVPRVTVTTGPRLMGPGGTPVRGRILFVGPDLVVVPALDLTIDGAESMSLAGGIGSVDLVPSDLEGMNPRGWDYEVRTEFTNAPNWVRHVLLTSSMTSPVKLADVLTPDPATPNYVPVKGDQGPAGPPGADGAPGSAGGKGDPGAPGADGADGRSAYEVAVADGFVGSEAEWLASLKGPQGDPGSGGGSAGLVDDTPVGAGIVVLAAAASWTMLPQVSNSIPCTAGHRVLWSPSFLRGGTAFTLDAAILKADGSVSRYVSSGTATPGVEGYAPFYNNPSYKGVAGLRCFTIASDEIDANGHVTIAAAYIAPSIDPGDTSNRLYLGDGYDGYWLMWDIDA